MLSVNSQLSSLRTKNQMTRTQGSLNVSMSRLASGLRINTAADDAAGLSISTSLRAQVRGTNRAVQNANDWISLFQTAEGATNEMTNIMQRMRELSVQASNETYNDQDRESIQAEIDQLVTEIDRIGTNTNFNGIKVLDGDLIDSLMQIGANSSSGETVSISAVNTDSLGRQARIVSSFGVLTDFGLSAGDNSQIGINGITVRDTIDGDDNLSTSLARNSAIAKAAAINAVSAETGVSAHVGSTIVQDFEVEEIIGGTLDGDVFFTLNDEKISGFLVEENDADGKLRDAINAVSDSTGVVATLDAESQLILTAEDGRNINIVASDPDAELITGLVEDVYGGQISLSSNLAMEIDYIGVNTNDSLGEIDTAGVVPGAGDFRLYGVNNEFAIQSVNVSSHENANLAIESLDIALNQLSTIRSEFGALQNRLVSTINNLQQTSENLDVARSRIEDADFAQETASLSKQQIIQQASTTVLAQANQLNSVALQLLG
jgi:flagellin